MRNLPYEKFSNLTDDRYTTYTEEGERLVITYLGVVFRNGRRLGVINGN